MAQQLTEAEHEEMKRHVDIAWRIAKSSSRLANVAGQPGPQLQRECPV
jgi:HD-GYP domain-containing protein (c-di-GMP phosphodiesterase class II)